MVSDTELAYAAGLIDGEGHIGAYNTRTKGDTRAAHYQIVTHVTMRTPEPIEWLYERWPYGRYIVKPKKNAVKPESYFRWHARNRQAEEFLQEIRPFLILKGDQADLIFEFAALRRNQRASVSRCVRYPEEMLQIRDEYIVRLKALRNKVYAPQWADADLLAENEALRAELAVLKARQAA